MPGSKAVEHLADCFARLPGIGPKTAERLTYFLLGADEQEAVQLADAIKAARTSTKICSRCANLDEVDPCQICQDPQRDQGLIMVVEDPREVSAFLGSGYQGVFHVLQGRVSSLEGIGPDALNVANLLRRLQSEEVQEVCLATNPDLEGEATARMLAERLAALPVTVTRLARGIPAGASISQVSQSILADAVEGRRPLT